MNAPPVSPPAAAAPPQPAPIALAPLPAPVRRRARILALGLLCTSSWLAAATVGHTTDFGPELHRIGLAVHVLALVLSFGAILVVDWLGFLWLLGRRELHESGRLESAAKPLIWGGLSLLLLSGAVIHPDLGNPVTVVKLVCVLVLMLNGLAIGPSLRQLLALPPRTRFTDVGRRLRIRLLVALAISQACWWTAVMIGLVNSTLRRWAGT